MSVELSPEQQAILNETKAIKDPAELKGLLATLTPEMNEVFVEHEVLGPGQAFETTLADARSLYLLYVANLSSIQAVYPMAKEDRALFCTLIRVAEGIQKVYSEGLTIGSFRARTKEEVLEASRPWRARGKKWGRLAFSKKKPTLAKQFEDVNSTRTIKEEKEDLEALLKLNKDNEAALQAVGMTNSHIPEGEALLAEVEGRKLFEILGFQSQEDASLARNRTLTFLVLQAKQLKDAGELAFEKDPVKREPIEAISFSKALRRLDTPKKKDTPEETPQDPQVKPEAPQPKL
jgi:hypothetical protein